MPVLFPSTMGLPLLLSLLLSRAGFHVVSSEQPKNCITAESLCMADPTCNAAYQTLQNCSQSLSKNSFILLHHEAKDRCTEAQTKMKNSHFLHCRCPRRTQKEERCLQIYRILHSQGDSPLEMASYEDRANEDIAKTKYMKLATQVSGSYVADDSTNPCLVATNICHWDHKCRRQRSQYAQACSPCDQRRCYRSLRHFFEKVGAAFTQRLLFCPCEDDVCGERRWNTIVPECSFQSGSRPNCLILLDSCLKDVLCKSRLADFQEKCKTLDGSTDGCSPHSYDACLLAYMRMIGTSLTPNYVSNSSAEITLWCSCKNSGNQKEDCDQILNSFSGNKCLTNAIQAQMKLDQKNKEIHDQLQFLPSSDMQGDSTSAIFPAKVNWEPEEKKKLSDIVKLKQKSLKNSVYPEAQFFSFTLTLTLLFLILGLL